MRVINCTAVGITIGVVSFIIGVSIGGSFVGSRAQAHQRASRAIIEHHREQLLEAAPGRRDEMLRQFAATDDLLRRLEYR